MSSRVSPLSLAPTPVLFPPAFQLRDRHAHADDIVRTYEKYVNALTVVISALDKIVPKREWKRAGKAGS